MEQKPVTITTAVQSGNPQINCIFPIESIPSKQNNSSLSGKHEEEVLQWLFLQWGVSSEQGILELPAWRNQDKHHILKRTIP